MGCGVKSLGAKMYKRELDQTTSCCPVHLAAEPALVQPVLTHFYWLLDSLEMRAGQMLVPSSVGFHLAMNLQ